MLTERERAIVDCMRQITDKAICGPALGLTEARGARYAVQVLGSMLATEESDTAWDSHGRAEELRAKRKLRIIENAVRLGRESSDAEGS